MKASILALALAVVAFPACGGKVVLDTGTGGTGTGAGGGGGDGGSGGGVICGQMICGPGEVCLQKEDDAIDLVSCVANPCGAAPLACACATSVCAEDCISASGTSLVCGCGTCG